MLIVMMGSPLKVPQINTTGIVDSGHFCHSHLQHLKMSQNHMSNNLNTLIARLEDYSQDALAQAESSTDQSVYWRGVRFGVELALLEIRKQGSDAVVSDDFYEQVTKLVFERLDKLIELCQTKIPRELLAYNARLARYELLKGIRQLSDGGRITDYERQANPDRPYSDV